MSNTTLRATLAALQAERDALKAESESRRNKLLAISDERRAEWIRAENAEAEIARLKAEQDGVLAAGRAGMEYGEGWRARAEVAEAELAAIRAVPTEGDRKLLQDVLAWAETCDCITTEMGPGAAGRIRKRIKVALRRAATAERA